MVDKNGRQVVICDNGTGVCVNFIVVFFKFLNLKNFLNQQVVLHLYLLFISLVRKMWIR